MNDTVSRPDEANQSSTSETATKTISIPQDKQRLFDLFGKSHTMVIASAFAGSSNPWRFTELKNELDISQTTLSARLDELLEEDLITRQAYDEMPPRVEYEATEKLRAAKPVIQDFVAWWRKDW